MADLVPIFTAANLMQAQLLRDALADEDIDAWIINDALSGAVGELPVGWASSPRVVVSRDDAETARAIALEFEKKPSSAPVAGAYVEPAESVVDADAWPRCLMCAHRRLAVCRFCGHAGDDFPIGYAGPAGAADDAPLQLVCPTCDEPFTPRFYKVCEHCGYEFEDGIELDRPRRTVEEMQGDLTRVWIVIGGMIGIFAAIGVYLWWVMQ